MNLFELIDDTPKHNTFISFHHEDEYYKYEIETDWGNYADGFISKAVGDGDIDPSLKTETIRQKIRDEFISEATVTMVLIGDGTWRRKHVDWEIGSSLINTRLNTRTGLLGIIIPTYYRSIYLKSELTENGEQYNPNTIPPRLYDNVRCGYAKIYSWPSNPRIVKTWIHEAFERQKTIEPDQSRAWFGYNRSDQLTHWES